MAFLLSFRKDEKDLFEAFWVGYKSMDTPKFGAENKTSITFERAVKKNTVEPGRIHLAHCPGCGQTLRGLQFPSLRTLKDGQGLDLVIDEGDFNYIKSRFQMWDRVLDELREPFFILDERFAEMKPKSYAEWQDFIAERDAPPAIVAVPA